MSNMGIPPLIVIHQLFLYPCITVSCPEVLYNAPFTPDGESPATGSDKQKLWQHSGETSTISQLSLNSGASNGDCNGEMASVRDNRATNNDGITTTPQRKFNFSYIGVGG